MRGRKILLINPWIHDFAAYDLWAKPLGLLSLGAVLRANGCAVEFIDCLETRSGTTRKRWGQGPFARQIIPKPPQLSSIPRNYARYGCAPEEFMRRLDNASPPDAVLVTSMMTYWYPGVFETIRLVKERFPGVPVILGGVYATLCSAHARRFSGADHVVTHEGEDRVLRLLEEMWADAPVYAPEQGCLDSLPYPCFDLVPDPVYVCIGASRGCPYRCTYCASGYLWGHQRRRNPVMVAKEIAFWNREYEVHDFAFYDDALLTPHGHALRLLEEIITRAPGVRFHCPNGLHAREITRDMAALMREAGFSTIRLGLETVDASRQKESGGKVTSDEFIRAMENLHKAGYGDDDIGVYILCGLPGQGVEEIMDTVQFVKAHGGRPRLSEYSPIPHTRDWDAALKASRYPLAEEPLFHNNTLLPCRSDRLRYSDYLAIKQSLKEG